MLSKKEFNFFSGQDFEVKKGSKQKMVLLIAAGVLVAAAIGGYFWQRQQLNLLVSQKQALTQKIESPEVQQQLDEYALLNTQLSSVDEYMKIAQDALYIIDSQKYATTEAIESVESLLPSSVEIQSLNVRGHEWYMDCSTSVEEDIALLLYQINDSKDFYGATTSNVSGDPFGIFSFPVHFFMRGGETDAVE
jgi:Tfp pilus assembly protein PilN